MSNSLWQLFTKQKDVKSKEITIHISVHSCPKSWCFPFKWFNGVCQKVGFSWVFNRYQRGTWKTQRKKNSLRDISFTVESILIVLSNVSLIFATDYLCQILNRVWSSKQKLTLDNILWRTLALLLMHFLSFPWRCTSILFVPHPLGNSNITEKQL